MKHADFETTKFYYIFISDKRKKDEFKKANDKSFGKNDNNKNEEMTVNRKRFTKKNKSTYKNKCLMKAITAHFGGNDRNRTGTTFKGRRILSPVRLPVPPHSQQLTIVIITFIMIIVNIFNIFYFYTISIYNIYIFCNDFSSNSFISYIRIIHFYFSSK